MFLVGNFGKLGEKRRRKKRRKEEKREETKAGRRG